MVRRICLIVVAWLAGLCAGQPRCQGVTPAGGPLADGPMTARVASAAPANGHPADDPGFLHRDGERIVDGQGQEVILRGMGLGGWMLQEPYMLQLGGVASNQSQIRAKIVDLIGEEKTDVFYAAWRAHQTCKEDIDSLASWGFNCVRVPLHYNLFTLAADKEPVPGQNTWLSTGLALTDSLLAWCKAAHIYIILDLHAAPGGQGNDIAISDRDKSKPSLWQSPANQQKVVALWRMLAERYAHEPWIGGYDLLNETNWGFTNPATDEHGCAEKDNSPLRRFLERITDTIRPVDQQHLIFIEGNCWANNFHSMLPIWDSNMAVSFHKYWNYNDQGSIQGMLNMRSEYHVPLWLGESGENSNTWTTDAISLAERNHVSWTWWPLKKAGLNNPLEFHLGPGFRQIVAYWQGKGPRPSAADANTALMQLASDVATSANTYHKDVVDAMFRQVWTDQTLPYKPLALHPGAVLYAVNYDLGRNGFAYYDLDTVNFRVSTGHNSGWNRGGCYRNDGVDISRCADTLSNGYAVTDIERGEWLQYTVDVPKSGYYSISYRVEPVTPSAADSLSTAPSGPAAWKLLDYVPGSGAVLLDACGLPAGASDGTKVHQVSYVKPLADAYGDRASEEAELGPWTTAGNHKAYLKAGVHHLRLLAQEEGFRLSYIRFE